ncbi:response regulator [Litoribacillus peritrichatus]|uniref:histidine kinase n=1 Tax=Litoribacillus peritrichatus TaxID=718191 RepID=A0ABP7MF42_9GAMM
MSKAFLANNSVAVQLLKVVFGLYCIVAVSVTLVHIVEEYRYTQETIEKELKSYQKIFGPVLAKALWNLDREQIKDIVAGLSEVPVVVGVQIERYREQQLVPMAATGTVISHAGTKGVISEEGSFKPFKSKGLEDLFAYEFPITYEVFGEEQQLGKAILYSDSSVVLDRVKLGFTFLVINALIKGVALWIIFWWMSQKILLRPLNILTRAITSVKFDTLSEFKVDLKTKQENELTIIERAFTQMVDELAKAKQRVLDFNKHLEEEVTQRTRDLIAAKEQAEEASKVKSGFLATMSHEIRTPMNGVQGMLHLLEKTDINKKQKHYLELANTSANALLTLINDILDFSKIEAGKLVLESEDFELDRFIINFADVMAPAIQMKGLEVVVDVTGLHHSWVKGDSVRIQQVLSNLVGNAIKFTSEGDILIRAESQAIKGSDEILLNMTVADTGIGIEPSIIPKLFESFSQADSSTTRKYGGTGLGLAISKQLCELMGGGMSATSIVGDGSSFQFCVVLHASEHVTEGKTPVLFDGRSCLIIDDHRQNSELMKKILGRWQMSVTAVSNLNEAVALQNGKDWVFDVILVDVAMSEYVSESTIIGFIKSIQEAHSLPVIFVRTLIDETDYAELEAINGIYEITKPVSPDALSEVMRLAFRQDVKKNLVESKQSNNPTINTDHRILLVEDNFINQQVASGILEGLGFRVDVADNGLVALNTLKNKTDLYYSLILMDCQMPEMDGYEATGRIRNGEGGSHFCATPIIALTANAMESDRDACINAGMSDYIKKPIEVSELLAALGRWLD